MINVLLTSAGGLTGIYLAKLISSFTDVKLFTCDYSNDNPLKKWSTFVQVPLISDKTYQNKILEILKEFKIDIIIPVTSNDIDFFSSPHNRNSFLITMFLVTEFETNQLLSNKEKLYKFLSQKGLNSPKIIETFTENELPFFIKPQVSSGSKNSFKINSKDEYDFYKKKFPNSLITKFIHGAEYTVDTFFYKGKHFGYNIRERVKINGGGATVSQNCNHFDLDFIFEKLSFFHDLNGPMNFQFKVDKNGEIVIFDFNTRFASGGLPLTVASGFNIPRIMIDILFYNQFPDTFIADKKSTLKMIRFYEEYYEQS